MKKRVLSFALVISIIASLFVAMPMTVSAYTDGTLYYSISNGEVIITDYVRNASGSLTIPSTLGGYPVTRIGDYAFYVCSSLTSITIPDSVTSIGDRAFYGCSNLTSITIPDSVTSIGKYAFYGCRNLISMTLPFVGNSRTDSSGKFGYIFGTSSYTSSYYANGYYIPSTLKTVTITDATEIPSGAFYVCSSLTSITIPNSVTSIGSSAFSGCSSLTSVTIGNGATSIGSSAFSGCSSLTSITIPEGVTSIGDSAFIGCTGLTSITIPESVTSIGDGAFLLCDSISSLTVDANNSNYSSQDSVLFNKDKTTLLFCIGSKTGTYTIPETVTCIGKGAFEHCANLTNVTIPEGVVSIEEFSFAFCNSLTSVSLPSSVKTIEKSSFVDDNNLKTVYYNGSKKDWKDKVSLKEGNGELFFALVFEKNDYFVNLNGFQYNVEMSSKDYNGDIISAFYDNSGKLISIKQYLPSDNIEVEVPQSYYYGKIMWLDINSLAPHCEAKTIFKNDLSNNDYIWVCKKIVFDCGISLIQEYDESGNILSSSRYIEDTLADTQTYEYNKNGECIKISNSYGTTQYSYEHDLTGNITKLITTDSYGNLSESVSYDFEKKEVQIGEQTYQYNCGLLKKYYGDSKEYDEYNNIISIKHNNFETKYEYCYNNQNLIDSAIMYMYRDGLLIRKEYVVYDYDKYGNIIKETVSNDDYGDQLTGHSWNDLSGTPTTYEYIPINKSKLSKHWMPQNFIYASLGGG